MIELRPHQDRGVQLLREGLRAGHLRQVLVMPTGAGKTITAASLALSAKAKGSVTLFVVDRIELALQAAETMQRVGLTVSILQGENTNIVAGHDVVVASSDAGAPASAGRRLDHHRRGSCAASGAYQAA